MVAGEGLNDALGFPSGEQDPPLWAALLVGLPMTLLATAPAALAIVFGRRASRGDGGRAAAVAAGIGIAVAAYWVLTFAAGIVQRLAA